MKKLIVLSLLQVVMKSAVRTLIVSLIVILTAGCGGKALNKALSGDTVKGVKAKVLAAGSPIHGANGLYFGPDGNLYIGSVFGREIIKMNPNTGKILDRIGPERGVESPDDLTFGKDGSLYWTAIATGEVGKIGPDGKKSTVANLGKGVNPITIKHDDGRMFVGQAFFADSLFEVYEDGRQPRLILEKTNSINAFDFGCAEVRHSHPRNRCDGRTSVCGPGQGEDARVGGPEVDTVETRHRVQPVIRVLG